MPEDRSNKTGAPRTGHDRQHDVGVSLARRRLLGSFALSALSVAVPGCATRSPDELSDPVAWSSGSAQPKLVVPAGSVDCHHHIFSATYPNDPRATNIAPDALVPDYLRLRKRLRLSRSVLVQPSAYGTDNRCLLDALRQLGETARGVVVVPATIDDDELMRLDRAGVRGARFNLQFPVGVDPRTMVAMSRRIAPLGWHIQVNATADQFVQNRAQIMSLECPVVFDHMAQLPQPGGTQHAAFAMMRDLVRSKRGWVKLSGAYQTSKVGPPTYADSGETARALIDTAPGQLLWGTNWPHPSQPRDHKPDDAVLLDLLAVWAPEEAVRRRILVENPQRLYGFRPVALQGANSRSDR